MLQPSLSLAAYDSGNLFGELMEPTMRARMTLSALLVCVDEAAAEVLRQVLKELSIRVESCPDFARAAIRAAQERFDVIIVDGHSSSDVLSLLRETRMSRLNDATLAVAVVPSQESIRELFSLGVNFVLYKPVAYDRALSSLRAARAVMRKEKRKSARAAVHTHATVDYANVEREKATLIDLAHDGMSVMFGKKLPPTSKVYFLFKLPGQSSNIRLSGQLVWQDWNGRGGVQFVDVPKASRRLLDEFLSANLPKEEEKQELSDVTVEVEEPMMSVISREKTFHDSAVVSVIIGDTDKVLMMWKQLFDEGIFVNAFIRPGVPPGMEMLRTSYMATHKSEHLEKIQEVFKSIGKKMGVIQ